jgi:hypothetical protein
MNAHIVMLCKGWFRGREGEDNAAVHFGGEPGQNRGFLFDSDRSNAVGVGAWWRDHGNGAALRQKMIVMME